MAVDSSNEIRVDLQEIYNSCEQQTAYHSRIHKNDEDNQRIIICADDYSMIHAWANEAAALIADTANYITNTSETPFAAITNPFADGETNPNDEKEIIDLMANEKQTGEYLDNGEMDTLSFNVDQMEGFTPLKYTVTQTYIRGAIIEYVLFKWYELNKIPDAMALKKIQFDDWLGKILHNTFSSQKTIKTRKPYRLF